MNHRESKRDGKLLSDSRRMMGDISRAVYFKRLCFCIFGYFMSVSISMGERGRLLYRMFNCRYELNWFVELVECYTSFYPCCDPG